MNKAAALKIVNPIIAVLFISQASTGIFHKAVSHELFELLHEKGGYLLAAGIVLHIALNWGWIKNSLRGRVANQG